MVTVLNGTAEKKRPVGSEVSPHLSRVTCLREDWPLKKPSGIVVREGLLLIFKDSRLTAD
jgi:hypothetical protein